MSITLSDRSTMFIASAYGAAKTFSSISNASEAVASFAADPSLAANDIIEVTSGWGYLDKRVVRVKTVSGAGPYLVTLEAVDTSNTTRFPAGSGAGTIREITTFTQVTQVDSVASSGGDQQYARTTALEDDIEKRVPTRRTPVDLALTVYDDPTLAGYAAVNTAHELNTTPYALKIVASNGGITYANAYWSLLKVPLLQSGEATKARINIGFCSEPMRYAS